MCEEGEMGRRLRRLDVASKVAGEPLEQSDPLQPFFCGSPPTRSANPVVLDTRFSETIPLRPAQCVSESDSENPQTGFDRTRFGPSPAAVRIEGFDCLGCNCSCTRGIPAVA
ncbi:uncharacterized protein LOC110027951 [Phalaenopsis equestris]|uniref:uncharacterized protein LOC110027951 n=1 Tax=Phalaenopsis equestris TaxID=78828 RepID=UPI0009E46685|nr:uncharacterized protein LOC110027951 [Phalaenopsis equestris]